jgi:murein DD-endopeptidase MepM/ murein hydrolase activator NlpD
VNGHRSAWNGSSGRPLERGWATARRARERRSRFLLAILAIPLVFGLAVAPVAAPSVRGDELSDAKARQQQLKKQIADQKEKVAAINGLQASLAAEIRATKSDLRKIGTDLTAVKKKITKMETKIAEVKAIYEGLLVQLRFMDMELSRLEAQEQAKRDELTERRALLADRVRNAYDTDRTSPLETFLSGGTFTDLLAEMSYYIDIGEQDEALARQITTDKETLAAIHITVAGTRQRTNELRKETAAQKRALDAALVALKETKAELKKLEKKVAKALREQQARYASLARNKSNAAAIIRKAAADQRRLARQIDELIEKQVARGNFHNGIDLVAPYGTKVKAAAAGTVVYVGWNWADGADPAWIVVIAHSENLRSWYAHMQPKRPVSVGEHVDKGQVIGYEGSTGRSTGAHLHWMVELNGNFVNPRLFL